MRNLFLAGLAALAVLTITACADAQTDTASADADAAWHDWPQRTMAGPAGTAYIAPGSGLTPQVYVYAIEDIEALYGYSIDEYGTEPETRLRTAVDLSGVAVRGGDIADGRLTGASARIDGKDYAAAAAWTPDGTAVIIAVAPEGTALPVPGQPSAGQQAATPAEPAEVPRTQAGPATPLTSTGRFAPPATDQEVLGWHRDGIVYALAPGDVDAPRGFNAVSGPKWGYDSFEGALSHLVKNADITPRAAPAMRTLDAWTAWDGRTTKLVVQPTRLAGKDAMLVLLIIQKREQTDFTMFGYEATEADYRAWGGIARMMQMRGIIPGTDVFPAAERDRILAATPAQQVELYNAALNKQFNALAAGMVASMQAQTVLRMQELNYDLLFGGDITSPMIAD